MASLIDKAKEFVAEKIANIAKPEASLTDVSIKSFNQSSTTFHSEVTVTNLYNNVLPIYEIFYTLKSAGSVRHGIGPRWIKAAREVTKLEVPLKVPCDFLISLLMDIGRDWDIDYELEVGLTIDLPIVGNLTLPLSTKAEMKLPTLSDIFW